MKKALKLTAIALICFILVLCFASCGNDETPSSSDTYMGEYYTSGSQQNSNTVKIIGNTVVHTNIYYGEETVIVFTYKNGQLDSAELTKKCSNSTSAKNAYDIFTNLNKHASSPMYEDIELNDLTLTLKYTSFTLQNYRGQTMEGLKLQLENESLEP